MSRHVCPRKLQPASLRHTAVAATLAMASTCAQAVPVIWVGLNASFWDLAANWSPSLPGAPSDVSLGAFSTEFRSGTVTVQSISGTKLLTVSGGNLSATAASTLGSLYQSGGTLTGTGSLTVFGPATWTSGTMSGSGTTTFSGNLELSGISQSRGVSGRTLNLNGTTTWTNTGAGHLTDGQLSLGSGATINNHGAWLDQVSVNLASGIYASDAASSFNNFGAYTKTGQATTTIQVAFNNAGTVDVQAGTLVLPTNWSNAGTVMGKGQVQSNGVTNHGHFAPGDGIGALTVVGNLALTSDGFLDVELESATSTDLLKVTGTASLSGTLDLVCFGGCDIAAGTRIKILDAAANGLTGSFSRVVLEGFSQGEFQVVYDRTNGDVWLNGITQTASAVPEPSTCALGLVGVATLGAVVRRRRRA